MPEARVTPLEPQYFLTKKMVAILQTLSYDRSSINTLIDRADSNTISTGKVDPSIFLDSDDKSVSNFIETTLLDQGALRQRNIYLNSNEPILLIEITTLLDLEVQCIRDLKERVLSGLRDRGIKPVRVYIRETNEVEDGEAGMSFSLLNVVNSDIGVNMVSLLDSAFYGADWKEDLVSKEGWNGYDLIWRDEAWTGAPSKQEDEVILAEPVSAQENAADAPAEIKTGAVTETDEPEAIPPPIDSGVAGAELERMPSVPERKLQYKSADDVPDDTDEDEPTAVQHPALKELLERDADRPPVQHPTWSRSHDSEAYLDIIKTHSRGQNGYETISTISRSEPQKDDFEMVDKP